MPLERNLLLVIMIAIACAAPGDAGVDQSTYEAGCMSGCPEESPTQRGCRFACDCTVNQLRGYGEAWNIRAALSSKTQIEKGDRPCGYRAVIQELEVACQENDRSEGEFDPFCDCDLPTLIACLSVTARRPSEADLPFS
jgi:hypothetical protein